MIGTQTRGLHHLARLLTENEPRHIFFQDEHGQIHYGEVVLVGGSNVPAPEQKWIYIYNDIYRGQRPTIEAYKREVSNILQNLASRWKHVFGINSASGDQERFMNVYFSNILLLPIAFEKDYENNWQTNKKQFGIIEHKYAHRQETIVKALYVITDGSKNLFLWANSLYFGAGIDFWTIKRLVDWVNTYGQLQKNLKKGTVTAYTNKDQINQLLEEMADLRRNKRINDAINSFGSQQKKLLRDLHLSNSAKDVLSRFGNLSTVKKVNFIKKMSNVDNADEIIKQMSYLVNSKFKWSKDDFIDYVTHADNLHAEIIFINGDIVLVKVDDYDAVKYLGRSTNWCISKNKSYWNQYVLKDERSVQYMIFDFSKREDDPMSIIGFTSAFNKGITHAHDFVNHDIMGDVSRSRRRNNYLHSFLDSFNNNNGIYSVLEKDGIRLCDVTSYDPLPFKWTYQDFFAYLNKFILSSNYDIISDDGTKVAIIVQDQGIKYFLGNTYAKATNSDTWRMEHIIFADFAAHENDPDKLIFGIVCQNDSYESYVNKLYNEHFDVVSEPFDYKLSEYNLPYDTICRSDDKMERFINAVSNNDIPIVESLLSDDEFLKYLKNGHIRDIGQDYYYEIVNNSLLGHYSLDLLNLIYAKGFTLYELLGSEYASEFIKSIFHNMYNVKAGHRKKMTLPSDTTIKRLMNGTLPAYDDAVYVGLFQGLNIILHHETNSMVYCALIHLIVGNRLREPINEYIFDILTRTIKYDSDNGRLPEMVTFIVQMKYKNAYRNLLNSNQRCVQQWLNNAERHCGINHAEMVQAMSV